MFRSEAKPAETRIFEGPKRSFFCMDCFRVFEREIPWDLATFVLDMKAAHCPDCGAGWMRIGFHRLKPA